MRALWTGFILLTLCGCAAMPNILDTLFGNTRQRATREPLYVYKADLYITVDGTSFDGLGVTVSKSKTDIDIQSVIHLDRVEVETCSRQEVCENEKQCSSNFQAIDDGWFGATGKHMVYHYTPTAFEAMGNCPIYFRVYDKSALAAWGFLAFRSLDENVPAKFVCNGTNWKFAGHSVCQIKAGLPQQLSFDSPIDDFDADSNCGLTKIDSKHFEFRPVLGLCTAKFLSGPGHWHGLDLIAYDEVLVRQ